MWETWEAEASRTRKVTAAGQVQLHTPVVPDPSARLVGVVTSGPSCSSPSSSSRRWRVSMAATGAQLGPDSLNLGAQATDAKVGENE